MYRYVYTYIYIYILVCVYKFIYILAYLYFNIFLCVPGANICIVYVCVPAEPVVNCSWPSCWPPVICIAK